MRRVAEQPFKFFLVLVILSVFLSSNCFAQQSKPESHGKPLVAATSKDTKKDSKKEAKPVGSVASKGTDDKKQKDGTKAKSTAKEDFFSADQEDKPRSTATEEPPASQGVMDTIMPILKEYGLYIGIGLVVFIIVLVLISKVLSGGKTKSACRQCGKKVLPGMHYCETCSANSGMMLEMESMAPAMPAKTSSHSSSVQVEPRKKARPSGRVIATITVRKGVNAGYKYSFYESQLQMSIGRDPECDLVLEDEEDKEISNRHAVISMADGNIFTIHDMSSTVGIYVNSEQVKQSNLKSGDVIRISKTELTFARL